MSENNKKVPKLRFPEFDGEWKKRKFFDNIEKTVDFRGRTPKKLGHEWSEKGYLALSALNVKDGYIDFEVEAHYGDQKLYNKWMKNNELHVGQVLFTTEAPMGNVAQVPDNRGYILSQRTIAFVVNQSYLVDDFLAVLLKSPKSFNRLTSLSSGGTAKGVSQKSLTHFKITIPKDLDEQKKIGSLFNEFDAIYNLQQQKIDNLGKIKDCLLQKMFPHTNADTPEIHFPEFNEIWKTKKMKDVASIFDGTHQTPKYTDQGIKFVSVENITNLESEKYITNEAYEKEYSNKKAEKGDVLMTRIGNVGLAKMVEDDAPLAYYVTLALLKPEKLDSYFLTQLISNPEVQKDIWRKTLHVAFPKKINLGEIEQIKVSVPSIEEQQQIGEFFTQIDSLISLNERKLKHLQSLKKALLQQMFI